MKVLAFIRVSLWIKKKVKWPAATLPWISLVMSNILSLSRQTQFKSISQVTRGNKWLRHNSKWSNYWWCNSSNKKSYNTQPTSISRFRTTNYLLEKSNLLTSLRQLQAPLNLKSNILTSNLVSNRQTSGFHRLHNKCTRPIHLNLTICRIWVSKTIL